MSEIRNKTIHRKDVTEENLHHLKNKGKHQRTRSYTVITYRVLCYYQIQGHQEGLTMKKMIALF